PRGRTVNRAATAGIRPGGPNTLSRVLLTGRGVGAYCKRPYAAGMTVGMVPGTVVSTTSAATCRPLTVALPTLTYEPAFSPSRVAPTTRQTWVNAVSLAVCDPPCCVFTVIVPWPSAVMVPASPAPRLKPPPVPLPELPKP